MIPDGNADAEFENLLEYMRQSRGFDFTGYKRPSLMRRVTKRMQTAGVAAFSDYVDYLEVHPEEFAALFNTILINVTSFFRDPAAWECLVEKVIPRLISNRSSGDWIRVWSAGCASGEEAYSIAMLLCEALGREEFKRRVKLYATDADQEALTIARQATYTEREIQPVNENLRNKYFEPTSGRYIFNSDLRRLIIFGRHDLVQDAPMSRLDLLICRNVLMYFNAETQGRILGRFNYALNNDGYLFLGKAEMLMMHSNLFVPLDLKQRIFCKQNEVSLRDRLVLFAQGTAAASADSNHHANRRARVRDASFELGEIPQVIVDSGGVLVMANQQAREVFDINPKDIGRPFQDHELSYRPLELRSLIDQANAERKPVIRSNVERRLKSGETRYFEVRVLPLADGETLMGVCITFDDTTHYHVLEDEVSRARQESETVSEELQATNEELQSTNEELETTNEELQSTNEELETMNEELQSANEELQAINEELRQRSDELNQSNAFLNSILSSLRGGVVVVDKQFKILVWNHLAEDLWGLRADEVIGHSLLNLDIGLPVKELRNVVVASTSDGGGVQDLILDAVNRRGRSIKCRVTVNPYTSAAGNVQGAVITMEEMGM